MMYMYETFHHPKLLETRRNHHVLNLELHAKANTYGNTCKYLKYIVHMLQVSYEGPIAMAKI